jgi:hypothetical protein
MVTGVASRYPLHMAAVAAEQTTLLKALLTQRHLQRYESFRAAFDRVAQQIGPELRGIAPSRAQYYRWLAGELKGGLPYPDACRVLEMMCPPWTASQLFAPAGPDVEGPGAGAPSDLLVGIAPSFSARRLQGAWVTAYPFGQGRHHADIAHVTATSDRQVRIQNYPPEPRTEGHATPYRNLIEAELVNRHLVGVWKNDCDERYFGAIHLAVLPGETVIHGYYTGLTTDVQVDCGPWRWARLDPASVGVADLAQARLRDPRELYGLLTEHTQYDAPLAVNDVLED